MPRVGKLSQAQCEALRVLALVLASCEESRDGDRSALGRPRVCTSDRASFGHLVPLCRKYANLLAQIRSEFSFMLAADQATPEELVRMTVSLQAKAVELLRWDALFIRSHYVGRAEHFRHMGRGLGVMVCRRLGHCAKSAAEDPTIEVRALVKWLEEPAWFAEMRAEKRALNRRYLYIALAIAAGIGLGLAGYLALHHGWLR